VWDPREPEAAAVAGAAVYAGNSNGTDTDRDVLGVVDAAVTASAVP